ncbi:hypothetical protein KA005_76685 [bacterium]|nr:hypothetical protein [bacterium]
MKVFTTVEISKEDLDKPVDEEIKPRIKVLAMVDMFLELVESEIPVQLKFTNMPPRPYPGFRPASEI